MKEIQPGSWRKDPFETHQNGMVTVNVIFEEYILELPEDSPAPVRLSLLLKFLAHEFVAQPTFHFMH